MGIIGKKFFESRIRFLKGKISQQNLLVAKMAEVGTEYELHQAQEQLHKMMGQREAFEECLNYYN